MPGNPDPHGNTWGPYFAFPPTGSIQRQSNPLLAAGLIATGWKGFPTMQDAQAYLRTIPAIPGAHSASVAAGQTVNAASALPSGISAIGDFFARLTQKATWERVAEFTAGGMLLYIGVKALTTPAGQKVSTQGAKTTLTRIVGKTPQGRLAKRI